MEEPADRRGRRAHPTTGTVYLMGLVGALVYYLQRADGFWDGVWGVVQAILWPGFLIYHLLTFLGA